MGIKAIHNERELLTKVMKGNEKAFSDLFYAYHQQIGAYVMLLTGDADLTEEIVQDVFVKVWLNREAMAGIEKFTSYLFIITRNYTLNCIRKLVADRKLLDEYGKTTLADAYVFLESPDETFRYKDYQSVIDRAIAQLPAQQQKVFVLRQKGLKNPEIAKQMNISPDSVKKYQQWALKFVSEFVKTHASLSILLAFVHHKI